MLQTGWISFIECEDGNEFLERDIVNIYTTSSFSENLVFTLEPHEPTKSKKQGGRLERKMQKVRQNGIRRSRGHSAALRTDLVCQALPECVRKHVLRARYKFINALSEVRMSLNLFTGDPRFVDRFCKELHRECKANTTNV